MKKLIRCPVCNSENLVKSFSGTDKNLKKSNEIFYMNLCKNCNNYIISKIMEKKDFLNFYPSKNYYSYSKIDKGIKSKFKTLLYKIYFSENNNIFLKTLLLPFRFIIRGTKIIKNASLLDIGCGSGQFLYEMKKADLNVLGIEPGPYNKEEAKINNLKIINKPLEKLNIKNKNFDLITLNHVLEHLQNPNESIKKIKSLMKEESLLIIGVPNNKSFARFIFQKNWYQWDIPRHIVNYSTKTLTDLLRKNGFKIEKIRYNSRPSQFVISIYYLLNIKKPSNILTSLFNILFLPFTWIANLLKIGDQVEVWCRKIN